MTVAVAHQVSAASELVMREALKEAKYRQTELSVLHVVDSIDPDRTEAYRAGISDGIEKALGDSPGVTWALHLATAADQPGHAILDLVDSVGAELLVIGARRRSPVGKALMGSVAQSVILESKVPVLVVKAP